MYFYCAPINERAVTERGKTNFDRFFQSIYEKFDFPLMGNPNDSVMQAEWFYDANVHLNAYGMTVYTALLTDAIKTKFGNTTPGTIQLPSMPALPKPPQEVGEGDNTDVEFFLFEENEKGELGVVGLTELGKKEKSLIVPWSVNGKKVMVLSSSVFKNNDKIEEIVIQENISRLPNESFDGCISLKKIYLKHDEPSKLSISTELLLKDTPNAAFYVREDLLPAFISNYFWGYYANSLKGYA